MSLLVKQKGADTLIRDGIHRARLATIRPFQNAYGERVGFEFVISDGPCEGQTVTKSTAPQLTRQSKLAEVVAGILGRELTPAELDGGIDLETLVGIDCSILVMQARTKAGAVYSNVERVFQA